MTNNQRNNKPIKNYQKKKYYTNRNVKIVKTSSWVDGDFVLDPKTWECKHRPKKN